MIAGVKVLDASNDMTESVDAFWEKFVKVSGTKKRPALDCFDFDLEFPPYLFLNSNYPFGAPRRCYAERIPNGLRAPVTIGWQITHFALSCPTLK